MTWKIDAQTGDVIDHNGNVVGSVDMSNGYKIPDDVLAVMRDTMDDSRPSAYNQSLIADAATQNIDVINRIDSQ